MYQQTMKSAKEWAAEFGEDFTVRDEEGRTRFNIRGKLMGIDVWAAGFLAQTTQGEVWLFDAFARDPTCDVFPSASRHLRGRSADEVKREIRSAWGALLGRK